MKHTFRAVRCHRCQTVLHRNDVVVQCDCVEEHRVTLSPFGHVAAGTLAKWTGIQEPGDLPPGYPYDK